MNKIVRLITHGFISLVAFFAVVGQSRPPLLPEPVVAALSNELSGETAKRNLEFISRQHRMRASQGYRAAAEFVAGQARTYGLQDVSILQFPADGKTFYGTQKARPAWDADFAELWELGPDTKPLTRIASWDAMPLVLAQDSESANITADLIDVGGGTNESDYAGKDVKGKLVLVSSQPEAAASLAVDKFGAVGILSYAQNQRTAWWGDNDNLIRWGHLDSFAPTKTFAFMLSLKQARGFQSRLARGEKISFKAEVKAGRHDGMYDIVTGVIPGADPNLRDEEIAFSCHLDHPRPGANDNASGCVGILEVARTLSKLIDEGKIKRPRRTIRFIWPPEVEGSLVLLNSRPDLARRIKAVIHMDMVGGGPETKAVFHVTRGPASLPSFVYDVAQSFGAFVNDQTGRFAGGETVPYPLTAPEGGKEPLLADFADFTLGSDHDVYADSSFGIPPIYLNDWPDRYIHTNFDTAANIDPTKLKRAGFIGAASGYFLANFSAEDVDAAMGVIKAQSLRRTARLLERRPGLSQDEAANLVRFHFQYERSVIDSFGRFVSLSPQQRSEAVKFIGDQERLIGDISQAGAVRGDAATVYRRNSAIKGNLSVFGYDYFTDKYGVENAAKIGLSSFKGLRGSGGEYTYEAVNFVDGVRNVQQVRDAVSAEYGPVPLDLVIEYLRALESINIITK